MRRLLLILLAAVSTLYAQMAIPRDLYIHNKSGTVDTLTANEYDSVMFDEGNRMTVHKKDGTLDTRCFKDVDSLRFPYYGGQPVTCLAPQEGAEFHVGDTLILEWEINPAIVTDRVIVQLNMHDGQGAEYSDWKEICVTPTPASGNCQPGKSDTTIYTGNRARMKIPLANPMETLGGLDTYDPISDSCRIKLSQYESGGFVRDMSDISARFSIKP